MHQRSHKLLRRLSGINDDGFLLEFSNAYNTLSSELLVSYNDGFSAGFIAFHFNMKRQRKNMPAAIPSDASRILVT